MKYTITTLLLLISFQLIKAQQIPIVKFDYLERIQRQKSDTTYVINFWATWCAPCVAELPIFDLIHQQYLNKKVKVILVSLDSYKKVTAAVIPLLQKKNIVSEVILLDEPNVNKWIDKISPQWQGSIPATLIVNNKKKLYRFMEKVITFEDIQSIIR